MGILDFLFPPVCKICNTEIRKGALCPFCADKINVLKKSGYVRIYSQGKSFDGKYIFDYDNEIVKDLLFAVKRKGNGVLFEYASQLYGSLLPESDIEFAVVNVPRSRENVRKYGYDHVSKPCKILCGRHKKAVFAPVLKRCGKSDEQKNLTREQRKNNVHGNFYAIKKDIPKNILLVDDVVTTSSTASECIKELLDVYPDADIRCIFLARTN
jgi:predicted amidophosphoribosyltransferase